jgi:hypothetical protein
MKPKLCFVVLVLALLTSALPVGATVTPPPGPSVSPTRSASGTPTPPPGASQTPAATATTVTPMPTASTMTPAVTATVTVTETEKCLLTPPDSALNGKLGQVIQVSVSSPVLLNEKGLVRLELKRQGALGAGGITFHDVIETGLGWRIFGVKVGGVMPSGTYSAFLRYAIDQRLPCGEWKLSDPPLAGTVTPPPPVGPQCTHVTTPWQKNGDLNQKIIVNAHGSGFYGHTMARLIINHKPPVMGGMNLKHPYVEGGGSLLKFMPFFSVYPAGTYAAELELTKPNGTVTVVPCPDIVIREP